MNAPWQDSALGSLRRWRATRAATSLMLGFPALAALLLGAVMLCVALAQDERGWRRSYATSAREARSSQDWDRAKVLLRALIARAPRNEPFRYQLAMVHDAKGRTTESRRVLESLVASPGSHPEAHYQLAVRRLNGPPEACQPEAVNEAVEDLSRAVDGDPGHPEARALLCSCLLTQGDDERLRPHLLRSAEASPHFYFDLADLEGRAGRTKSAQFALEAAQEAFGELIDVNPTDVEAQLHYAQALIRLERFLEAAVALRHARNQRHDRRYERATSRLCLAWSEASDDPQQQVRLLTLALEWWPHNRRAIQIMTEFALAAGQRGDAARRLLIQMLADGRLADSAHPVLGTAALLHGQPKLAALHLRRAVQTHQRSPEVLMQVAAWMAFHHQPANPAKALPLANVALHFRSTDPNFREIRGRILHRLGRHQEALSDLETALRSHPNRRSLHVELAAVYAALGHPEAAQAHRQLAK